MQGYIVVNTDGKYLDRNMRWRSWPSARYAYVHSQEVVVAGGPWAAVAVYVFPALYKRETDFTEVTGKAIAFSKFVADTVMAEAAATRKAAAV